jgi:LuxR family transcriptional regulator, maltose regulon positive regulatory protein
MPTNQPISTLSTKLHRPPPRADALLRVRLIQRLETGAREGRTLTVISAPAGFGKTTLISAWLQQSQRQVAWLSLDQSDNDPIRFWRYVIAALQTLDASWGATALAMLIAPQMPPLEVVVTALINDLVSATAAPIVLVVDDYHVITDLNIHTSLDFFLDHVPPHVPVAITTREDPPLSLPRRRARQQLTEVRAADLRFTLSEATELLNSIMRLGLTGADITALEQRTEGWAVGLQMAALSLQGRSDQHDFITAFAGDDRYIADYLLEEVIQRQPAAVQDFLLRTSFLPRLNAALCDAVLERRDSRSVLADLDRANLFIVSLDNRREWYRYHHLFSDLLRQRLHEALSAAQLIGLYESASIWFEQHGLIDETISLALKARDYDRTVHLLEQYVGWFFKHSELQALADHVGTLPPEFIAQHIHLLAMSAWALLASGHAVEAQRDLQTIEQVAGITEEDWPRWADLSEQAQAALMEVTVMRMRFMMDQGNFARVLALAQQALPRLADDGRVWLYNRSDALRPPVRFMVGVACELRGELPAAEAEYRATVAEGTDNPHIMALALGHLGSMQLQQGQLRTAADTYRQALRLAEEMGRNSSPFFGISHAGYGGLLYEWNDLATAQQQIEEGLAQGKVWNSWEALLPGYLNLARVKQAQGDWAGAFAALEDMLALTRGLMPAAPLLTESARAWLWLRQGRLEKVERWAGRLGLNSQSDISPGNDADLLLLAQLLIAQNKLPEAATLLQRLIASTESSEHWTSRLTAQLLHAVVLAAQNRSREAQQALALVLRRAEPEGYVRLFVDAGLPVARLLYQAIEHDLSPEYARRLLAAFPETDWLPQLDQGRQLDRGPQPDRPAPATEDLIEPLSDREVEVLRLIDQGLSNSEIAAKLVLSTGTVKVHSHNIFSKLGVSSRTQAVNKARALGLL